MSREHRVHVIGCGGHAKVVVATLRRLEYEIAAVFDDDPARWGTALAGIPITGPVDSISKHDRLPAVIAIGDVQARKAIAAKLNLDWLTAVHPDASVDDSAELGQGTVVFSGAVIQPGTRIGNHAIVNTSASVDHDCDVGDFAHIAPGAHLAGGVKVGAGAFVGMGASVLQCVSIGAGTTVGANAAVLNDLEADVVAVGVPARVKKPVNPLNKKPRDNDMSKRIFLSPPYMSPRERELLLDAFDSNWIAPLGPHVDLFEKEVASRVGTQEAVALSSGTAALHLALLLMGVGRDDEVLASTLTFAATANVITYVGAQPVFVDSNRETWNMDPALLAEELETRAKSGRLPKAVIVVDLYGQCADYDPIEKTCRSFDIPILEDAAGAIGATYRGRAAGNFGTIGAISFNGNKIITTSGGGMLTTNDRELAQRARFLATQSRDPAPYFQHSEVGYNYRLSNLLAAVGRGQLGALDSRIEQRRKNFEFYRSSLGDLPGISFMPEIDEGGSTRWLSCILVAPEAFGHTAEDIRLALEERNIESRPVFKPMHLQPIFKECRVVGGKVSEALFEQGLCLPSGSCMSDADRARVVDGIRSVYGDAGVRS